MKKLFLLLAVLLLAVSIPSPVYADSFSNATTRVTVEAEHLSTIYEDAPYGWCVAVSAVNYSANYLSPTLYNYWTIHGVVIKTVDAACQYGAGICGTQTLVFVRLMQQLSIPIRIVQCYNIDEYNGSNHIFAEVWYNNKWNVFDCTLGAFFSDGEIWETMSFEELRTHQDYLDHIVFNELGVFNLAYTEAGLNPLEYITSSVESVLYAGNGQVGLTCVGDTVSLANVPNFIGIYSETYGGGQATISYLINNVDGKQNLNLSISSGSGTITATAGGESISVSSASTVSIDLSSLDLVNGLVLSTNNSFIMFSSITATGIAPPEGEGGTLILQPSNEDGMINQGAPNSNCGNSNLWVRSVNGGAYRSFVRYAPCWNQLPAGAEIQSATFRAYYAYYTEANPYGRIINLCRMNNTSWSEYTLTWNNCGTLNASDMTSATVPSSFGWVTWDITEQVRYAYTNNSSVNFVLKDSIETNATGVNAVFDANNVGDTSLRPILTINWVAN